jgi:hypothetical protein
MDGINQILGTRFSRVTDYTDIAAILVTPFSYKYVSSKIQTYDRGTKFSFSPVLVCMISIFAFVATTLPRQRVRKDLIVNEKIICHMNKKKIFESRIQAGKQLSDKLQSNLSDSLFLLHFRLDEHDARVETWVKIYSIDSRQTVFEIDSLDSYIVSGRLFSGINEKNVEYVKNLNRDDIITLFKKNVIDKIEDKNLNDLQIYFDNPRFDHTLRER